MAKTPSGKRTQPIRPYSDDKKTKGRWTGQTVKAVDRDEDEFEDFDKVYELNEPRRQPLRSIVTPRNKRISQNNSGLGSGDMSLAEDTAEAPTPSAFIASLPRPAPSSMGHLSVLNRRVDRSYTTDFDSIPSPVPSSSHLSRRVSSDLSRSFNSSRPRPKPKPAPARHPSPSPPQHVGSDSDESMDMYDHSPPFGRMNSPEPVAPSPSTGVASRKSRKFPSLPAPDSDSSPDNAHNMIPTPTASPSVSTSRIPGRVHDTSDEEDYPPPHRNFKLKRPSANTSRSFVVSDGEGRPSPSKSSRRGKEASEDSDPVHADNYGDYPSGDEEPILSKQSDKFMEVDEDRLLVARHSKQRKKENPTSRHSKKALSPVEEEGEGEHPADSGASNGIGDDVREEAPSKPKGKGKVKSGPMKRKKKSKSKLTTVESTTYTEDGLRRGTRRRFRPLEYWRGERLILGRSENGPAPCPVVKTLYELPPEFHEPLGVAGRKRKRHGRSQSGSRPPPSKDRVDSPHDLVPPEEGWDADTPLQGPTLDFDTGAEITRRVAVTARNMEPGEVPSGHFAFQKVFLDGDFIASGVITIPVGGKKPLKGARDNTFVFFCHTGAVRARIHSESYILAPGGTFLVPRGNQYEIVNISKRECVLFFAQARVMMREELDGPDPAGSSAARSSIAPSARSSLAATPTKSGIAPGSKFKASGSAKRRS